MEENAIDSEALLRPSPDLSAMMCDTADFISRYQWVWDVQMTKFFQTEHWNKIPSDWWAPLLTLTTEELNKLPFGFIKQDWPTSLKSYVSLSQRVCLSRVVPHWVSARAVSVGGASSRNMTPKKTHEVGRMAGLVDYVCKTTGCSVVLDIGSGLGYLGHVLREKCGLKVIGVEREGERVSAARQKIFSTVHMDFSDSHDCQSKLSSLLNDIIREEGGGGRVCLVGLHSCGDLTPYILRMVSGQMNSDLCAAAVVVGCCYHKMSLTGERGVGFNCFPMSAHLRATRPDVCGNMNVFALRLASQETRARWRGQTAADHTHHQKSVTHRGVLQAVCPEVGRVKISKSNKSFKEFAREAATRLNDVGLEKDMIDYHLRHHHFACFTEPFTALQVCMQGAMETLLLGDRLTFLRECGLSPSLVPLFDDLVSPRNIAIVTTTLPLGMKTRLKH